MAMQKLTREQVAERAVARRVEHDTFVSERRSVATTTKFSVEQLKFLEACRSTSSSIVLEAVAGSGKTTTILEAASNTRGGCAILAYNKKIALEIKDKLEKRGIDWKQCRAGTVHSFGFAAYRKAFGDVIVEDSKLHMIADRLITSVDFTASADESDPLGGYRTGVVKLVSLAKQMLIGVTCGIHSVTAWRELITHFDLEFGGGDDDDAIADAIRVLKASIADRDTIDFDDMIFMPLALNLRFWQYATIFLDEAQDTNNARRELCRRMLRPGGRLIAVGDPHQAIYGFTGADSDSLDIIRKEFNAHTMPLSVTFRCPQAIVDFARQWVNHITAKPNAAAGSVGATTFDELIADKAKHTSTAILCRNTAPLITAAFGLIRAGVSCRVEGRDIGKNLLKIINRWKVSKLETFELRLDKYDRGERSRLIKRKAKDVAFAAHDDRIETIRCLIEQCRSRGALYVEDLRQAVEALFADDVTNQLVLSTIHKSKGREWPHVVWLDREELYRRSCQRSESTPWQIGQEHNLCYVAATRSLDTLRDVLSISLPNKRQCEKPLMLPAPEKPASRRRKKENA